MLIVMMIVKNEADRYLKQCLDQISKFADKLVILDDSSTDDTVNICSNYTKYVYDAGNISFEKEYLLREKLFRLATMESKIGEDWLICLDADEIIPDKAIDNLLYSVGEAEKNNADAISFRLFDMWSDECYREDENWNAHKRHWVLAKKITNSLIESDFIKENLHCGRFPNNSNIVYRDETKIIDILHMGYSTQKDRKEKYKRYINKFNNDGYGLINQINSILDNKPNLKKYFGKKILFSCPIRETEEIFNLYLDALSKLNIPSNCTMDIYFILHNSDNLKEICEKRGISYQCYYSTNDYLKNDDTHNWSKQSVNDIILIKNSIAKFAIENSYDYVFMVDSDIMLNCDTLTNLYDAQKDIIANIFWSDWHNTGQYLPNCWYWDSYYMTEDALKQWKDEKGIFNVGMTGACILIKTDVYKKCLYDRIYNISFDGEDRFFCIRAACEGYQIFIDTRNPVTHLYRQSEVEKYKNSLTMRKDG